MLLDLSVKNFAIIDEVQLSFTEGFNVLSGETGAGKSILLKSLALLMGGKAATDTVRTGASSATIEGRFDISDRLDVINELARLEIEIDEEMLVVRRLISAQGKSRVYLNGQMATLANLKDVVTPLIEVTGRTVPLIEMTGQHDNRHLQNKNYHLELVDIYAGLLAPRNEYQKQFQLYQELEREISELRDLAQSREQRLDFLVYQRDEITELNLAAGEEVELENKVKRQKNASRLSDFAISAEASLYGDEDSALVRLHRVIQKVHELGREDSSLTEKLEPLSQAKTLIEEWVYDVRDYGQSVHLDAEALNRAEDRLSRLRRLQKKYGTTVQEILLRLEEFEREIHELENHETVVAEKERQAQCLYADLLQQADDLHMRRKAAADLLTVSVNNELEELNMKGVTFNIEIEGRDKLSSTGGSDVEFFVKASKKDSAKPLSKVASGGELSRILLSLKRVVSDSEHPRTYLFDEVDSGVSGETAEKVGKMLRSISTGQQVICVTHLPQVASFAHTHFSIEKHPQGDSVSMQVTALTAKKQVREIARLLSGEKISQAGLENARQMLQRSQKLLSQ